MNRMSFAVYEELVNIIKSGVANASNHQFLKTTHLDFDVLIRITGEEYVFFYFSTPTDDGEIRSDVCLTEKEVINDYMKFIKKLNKEQARKSYFKWEWD